MTNPGTLNELTDLKNSGFGRPSPRHGLRLLYWFANDFLFFDNNNRMCWEYNPRNQFYGFHRFKNRKDKNDVKLLPAVNLPYYMVGNLNSAGADDLPDYVRKDYGNFKKGNNMDRIIVSIDGECLDRVYVTEHCDRTDFNKDATYCISRGLIMIIRDMILEDFLSKTGYSTLQEDSDQSSTEDDDDDDSSSRSEDNFSWRPGHSRQQEDYSRRPGHSRQQEDYSRRPGHSRQQEDYSRRPGHSRQQEDYSRRLGHSRQQEDYSRRPGHSRQQEDYSRRPGHSRQQEDYSRRPGHSRQQEDYSPWYSRVQENADNISEEDEVNNFWDDNESTNCCRCVIL